MAGTASILSARRLACSLASAFALAGLAVAPASVAASLYSPSSPFNQKIPVAPAIDPHSASMVQSLVYARNASLFPLSAHVWTIAAYTADASTPKQDVAIDSVPPGWRFQLSQGAYNEINNVPIPAGAAPDPSDDGHMSILDNSTGCEYDFYHAVHHPDGTWSANWGNTLQTNGSGIYADGMSSRASGFSLAGMIWPADLQAGHIDHALVFAYPYTKTGGPVSPATASDGLSTTSPAGSPIPMGARVQLDPTLDLKTLNLPPDELTIATALQNYGMILGDTGGALSLFAINQQSWPTNPYVGLLQYPYDDYEYLADIPAGRFRVLTTGPQSTRTAPPWTYNQCGSFG